MFGKWRGGDGERCEVVELLYAPSMSATARGDVDVTNLSLKHGADPKKPADHKLLCPSIDNGIMPG